MLIVLHTVRYGDTSLIIHGYTEDEGRCSLMLRGAFRPQSGKRRPVSHNVALLHPLSILNYMSARNQKGSMSYLKEFSPKYRLYSIREDFHKISVAMFVSELLYRTLLHSERDPELYAFLENAVLRLEAWEGSSANFHLWFLDHYSAFLGFPFEKGFTSGFNPFSLRQIDRLATIHDSTFEEAMAITMTGDERKELVEAVLRWLEWHTGSRIGLRSVNVLHQISKLG